MLHGINCEICCNNHIKVGQYCDNKKNMRLLLGLIFCNSIIFFKTIRVVIGANISVKKDISGNNEAELNDNSNCS